jgi:D-alanyl-D-alanine carboxypeptidase/D-alanyl-D-alanine-endopeptidase (penicillin-binding protein 4)
MIKFIRRLLISFIIISFPSWLFAEVRVDQAQLANKVDALLQAYPFLHAGIQVNALESGQTLYRKHAEKNFTPASAIKLLTAVSAAWHLGEGFRFSTQVYRSGSVDQQGVLTGDIFIHFSGDPTLTRQSLQALLDRLMQQHGIKQVTGNIYLDDTDYDAQYYPPDWIWEDMKFCYAAPLSSIIVDKNCWQTALLLNAKEGSQAQLKDTPDPALISIDNQVRIIEPQAAESCPLLLTQLDNNHYRLSGCSPRQTQALPLSIAITQPQLYAKNLLTQLVTAHSLQLKGKVLLLNDDEAPVAEIEQQELFHLETIYSPLLTDLLAPLLKESDNLIAATLSKKLGQHFSQNPGSWQRGVETLQRVLTEKAGVDFTTMVIAAGVGGSRYSLLTPQAFNQVLLAVYRDPHLRSIILKALPEMGKEGTLQARGQALAHLSGKVYAKTGTMRGVSSLVGYFIPTGSKDGIAFSILLNGLVGDVAQYKQLEEEILASIVHSVSF